MDGLTNEELLNIIAKCRDAVPNDIELPATRAASVGDPKMVPLLLKAAFLTLQTEIESMEEVEE